MISVEELLRDQEDAARALDELGFEYERLNRDEMDKFARSFERQFVLQMKPREIVDMYMRHRVEILMGAMVATAQFKKRFDGERPAAGKFGMVLPRAGYFGIGDDWDDVSAFTGGSPQNWIHSGTTLMGGTAGHAIKIGENAVHVVFGVGSLHPAPKIESFQFTVDGKAKPIFITRWPLTLSDLAVKEFDTSFIFKKGTTLLVKVFQKQTGDDWPYLIGVSFVPENILREYHDVANLPGTVANVVLTT